MPPLRRAFGLFLALCWIGSARPADGQALGPAETWEIDTRACEQVAGASPWPCLKVSRLDEPRRTLVRDDPSALLARMAGRPVVLLIHGNGYEDEESLTEALEVRDELARAGGLAEGSLFVIMDWPSERALSSLVRDLNEKSRRSRIASYHLARFLQSAPPGSTICLMGQSDGGRVALTTMHLLSGAELKGFLREPEVQLDAGRPDLRFRCVVLEPAAAHNWLAPDHRLGHAMDHCEALLNLWNSGDLALSVYLYGTYTGARHAMGYLGLTPHDLERIGSPAARIEQINHHSLSGRKHTLFPRALEYPCVGPRVAAYTSFADVSAGLGRSLKTR